MDKKEQNTSSEAKSLNFIEQIIEEDIREGKNYGRVHTRFPPEPNGYLHIGHAKSICLNFGLAKKYNGLCNLRFDDTNPTREEEEYVESIMEDVRWLGFDWEDRLYYASDYFDQLYEWAEKYIQDAKAYVDDQPVDVIRSQKGTPTKPGEESPFRKRTIEENMDLFRRMRAGEFEDGSRVLRAKTGMSSPNMHMRDPIMYRIMHTPHQRTGDKWCIYPMYDWAHGESDFMEGITHSICTLEFEVHRPLYDWFLDQIVEEGAYRPRQIEFARLNLSYTVMSKRKLLELVTEKIVDGWNDPRMPTVSGLRRRGYTAESIRTFADRIGVAKRNNVIDVALLEFSVREDLNKKADRRMVVMDPLKVTITNYPEGQTEEVDAINNPENPEKGTRKISFSGELYIEKNDFMEDPPRKFFRLGPGREVRLKYGYIIQCDEVVKDPETGEVVELKCSYDPETKRGMSRSDKKVKGTLHWVSAKHAEDIEVRLYDRLFKTEEPDIVEEEGQDFRSNLNPESLEIITTKAESGLKDYVSGEKLQFERIGYFCVDSKYSKPGNAVYNRTVTLRDNWAKFNKK